MNKKYLFLVLPLLSVLALTSCGEEHVTVTQTVTQTAIETTMQTVTETTTEVTNVTTTTQVPTYVEPVDPADDGSQGSYTRRTGDWDKLLSQDYSNSTVYTYVSIGETESYIFNLAEGKYMNQYLVYEETVKQYFADYDGKNYVYWDCTNDMSRPNGKKGWINYNDKYEVDLSLEHQDFYYPNLYKITKDMVEYDGLFQEYFIKDEYVDQVGEILFGYAWDNKPEAIAITTSLDENNQEIINKIWAFDDLDKGEDGPFIMVQFGYIGTTATPEQAGFPEDINANNIYNYWEITGEEYEPPIFPEGINLTCVDQHESEAGYDVVMTVGDKLKFKYNYTNDGINKFGINTFNPDANDYRDNEGNYYDSFYDLIGAFNIESCWEEKTSVFQARNEGVIEVYVTYEYPGYPTVTSNKVKIKVNPVKEQPITDDTIYEINATEYKDEFNDPVWGIESGYYQTELKGVNNKETSSFHPAFDMTGYLVKTLEGRFTETFEDVDQVFDFSLGTASNYGVNYGMYRYLDFDLRDQEIVSLSFMYSLHTSGQLAYMKNNLTEAYIATSSDGVTWNTVKDIKEEMLNEFSKDSYMVGLTNHLMEASFEKTNHVRIYFNAGYYGQYFEILLANIAFDKDDTCAMHVDKAPIKVTGVQIDQEKASVRINNVTKLSATLSPSDATNHKIYWTSADPKIAQVNQKGEIKGIKEGKTTIKVYTDELMADGETPYSDEIEIEVLGKATLPATLTEDDMYYGATDDAKYALQVSEFNVSKGTLTVIYTYVGRNYSVTLTLQNEEQGVYTAFREGKKEDHSDDSTLVFGFNQDLSTMIIYPEQSKIKGFKVNAALTSLAKEAL